MIRWNWGRLFRVRSLTTGTYPCPKCLQQNPALLQRCINNRCQNRARGFNDLRTKTIVSTNTEGGLGVDDPVVAVQAAEEFGELLRIGKSCGGAGAAMLVATVQPFQTGEKLAAEDAAEDLYG